MDMRWISVSAGAAAAALVIIGCGSAPPLQSPPLATVPAPLTVNSEVVCQAKDVVVVPLPDAIPPRFHAFAS